MEQGGRSGRIFWAWTDKHPAVAFALVVAVVAGGWWGYRTITAPDPSPTEAASIRSVVHMTAFDAPNGRTTLASGHAVTAVCRDGSLYGVLTVDDRYVRVSHDELDHVPSAHLASCEQPRKSIAPHTTYQTRVFVEDMWDDNDQRWVPFTEWDLPPQEDLQDGPVD